MRPARISDCWLLRRLARDAGTSLHPAVLPHHPLLWQYRKHGSAEVRPPDTLIDIGAFEHTANSSLCDLNADPQVNVVDLQRLINIVIGIDARAGAMGDLDFDGDITELDVQILIDVILGNTACPV